MTTTETRMRVAVLPRPPATVMTLARMGSFHQCRLSFMRVLLRRMKAENWRFERRLFQIDAKGVGRAVYTAHGTERSYSLIAFANDLPPEKRSDRVIATEWDATFTLFDGIPSEADIERLSQNIPKQEAGRVTETELSVSRANRSVRLFDYVIDCLAAGRQPEAEKIWAVGYLMRTTAVYGSGKLGAADREKTENRPEFRAPFQVEMLSVYLTRAFVLDLVEEMARLRSPDTAVVMDPTLRRSLGIGNSTGLGMAPYLVNHPVLLNNWIAAREEALARVRSVASASPKEAARFREMLARSVLNISYWRSEHPMQREKVAGLARDVDRLVGHVEAAGLASDHPWDALWRWGEANLGLEAQELLVSLMMEPYGHLVDDLHVCMAADEAAAHRIDGAMRVDALKAVVEDVYGWALATDWSAQAAQARVWYTSEEKLEPRLGERFEEPLAPYEQPLAPGRDAAAMYRDLTAMEDGDAVAAFVLAHPEHRHIVRRAQIAARYPYAEIRDNTISAAMMPIDMLRAKLAFFGASHFDPRSDRWVRINMYRGAPFPHELQGSGDDDWAYPELEEAAE